MTRSGKIRTYQIWKSGLFLLVAGGLLAGLATLVSPRDRTDGETDWDRRTAGGLRETQGSFVHHFGSGHDSEYWRKSDHYYPNSPHPAWKAELVHFRKDRIELEVRRERTAYKTISGAEYYRRGFYHFGRYEVVMQAAPGSGTVSAMFTHTHDQFGDPHDEIDIEFLGKDLTRMYANYFADGRNMGGAHIPLGFDASQGIHLYAFEWDPDEIRWYVDDRLVYTATADTHPIPQTPGRLMLSLWSSGSELADWHGKPTFQDGARARYYCLSYRAAGDRTGQCSDTFTTGNRTK